MTSCRHDRRPRSQQPARRHLRNGLGCPTNRSHLYLAMREWEWCRENPMHRVSLEQVRNEVDRWLTSEEEDRLMAASSPWLREIMVFAMNTGMRQGEILNLQWQDVDFARGTLIVMKSKNGTRRTIPLNTKVFDLLAAKQSTSGGSRGPVFRTPLGNELQVRYLVREFVVLP